MASVAPRRSARLAAKYAKDTDTDTDTIEIIVIEDGAEEREQEVAKELIEKQAKEVHEMMNTLYSPTTQIPTRIWSIAKIFQKTATCKEMLAAAPMMRAVLLDRMRDFDFVIITEGLYNKYPEECKEYTEASKALRLALGVPPLF
jgi:vacuolar-type H+-ATPase subunit F/Vma7